MVPFQLAITVLIFSVHYVQAAIIFNVSAVFQITFYGIIAVIVLVIALNHWMGLVIFAIIRILAVNYAIQINAINVNKILLYSMEVVFVTIISSY